MQRFLNILGAVALVAGITTGVLAYRGYFDLPATGTEASPNPTPSASAGLSPLPSPMAGWKIYQDQYGFYFQYPETAKLNAPDNIAAGILLTLNPVQGGQIAVTQWAEPKDRYQNLSAPTAVVIGGASAQRYTYTQAGNCHGILVSVKAKDIEIAYDDCYVGGGSPSFPNEAQKGIFDQILSTFRFTK